MIFASSSSSILLLILLSYQLTLLVSSQAVPAPAAAEAANKQIDCSQDGVYGQPGDIGYTDCVDGFAEFHSCGITSSASSDTDSGHLKYDGERCVDTRYQCTASQEGRYRHNNSHRLYFECQNGISSQHYCRDGELFDGQNCVRVQRGPVTSGSHLNRDFECPNDGRFADPESRTHYIVCEEDEATVYRCPLVSFEHDRLRQWYEIYNTKHCVTPFECPEIDGTYKLTRGGGRVYYKCVNNKPVEHECQSGDTWDGSQCIGHGFQCPRDGIFSDPDARNFYILCYNGRPTRHPCPDGQEFVGRLCTDVRPRPRPFICPGDGRYVDPESPRSYYVCLRGLASHYSCSDRYLFDGTTCVSQSASGDFRCPQSYGRFVNPYNSSEYYQCTYGRPLLHKCSSGSHFVGDRCVHHGRPVNIVDPDNRHSASEDVDRHRHQHHPHDRFRVLQHTRDLVKFEFNNFIITDRFDEVAWKWNREIASIV
ncbi:uncharacterized protein LOC128956792 [Oppia nitens]|uniref:uncharacterized protein LOC128956792 n=1 Tax=Oppia nitens TaxID=1686743 RepID=UPI0023DB07EB|nr:uncharacterized protein LOC128956792 [Oppia nitens]